MENKSLKEAAQTYEAKRTLNITDLDRVDISLPLEFRNGMNQEGKEFSYQVMVINEQEYRVPNTVLEEIKKILKLKPDTKFVKVTKKGTGLATTYSVEYIG